MRTRMTLEQMVEDGILYFSPHRTEDGYVIDEFTLFAKVLKYGDDVTFRRYLDYGRLEWNTDVTISVKDFNRFYKSIYLLFDKDYYMKILRKSNITK